MWHHRKLVAHQPFDVYLYSPPLPLYLHLALIHHCFCMDTPVKSHPQQHKPLENAFSKRHSKEHT